MAKHTDDVVPMALLIPRQIVKQVQLCNSTFSGLWMFVFILITSLVTVLNASQTLDMIQIGFLISQDCIIF
jgi:hypothetical protein